MCLGIYPTMHGYDPAGNRTTVQDSLGGVMTSVYDTADRLTSRQFSASSGVLRFDTAYTARNQISAVTRFSNLAGTSQVGLSSMAYDAAGRETSVQHFNGVRSAADRSDMAGGRW